MDFAKIKARLDLVPEEFAGKTARFGWFPGAVYPNGQSVATVALIQEMGAPAAGIPARPFLTPTIEREKMHWAGLFADAVRAVGRGKVSADSSLDMIGIQAAGDVRKTISQITSPPLSPRTVKARAAKTASGQVTYSLYKPLVDTGLLLASVSNDVGTT